MDFYAPLCIKIQLKWMWQPTNTISQLMTLMVATIQTGFNSLLHDFL